MKPDPSRSKSPDPPMTQLYENFPQQDPSVQSSIMPEYDNKGYISDDNKSPVSHLDILPHFANAKDSNTAVHSVVVEGHQPPRSVTPFSEMDEGDVEEMFENVIKVGKETIERQQNEERRHQEQEHRLKEQEQKLKGQKSSGAGNLYTSHIESSLVRKTRMAASVSSDTPNSPKTAKQLLHTPDSHTSGNPAKRTSSYKEPRGSYVSETSSGTPMGVIQPTVFQKLGLDKQTAESRDLGKPSNISCMEDVPADLTTLTVEDVCQCLSLMNMDLHIAEFRTHQIDGKLLHDIRENVLLKEFHFTPFNASKLMRFVRGWRPKIS